jgi:hypothetical protein
MGPLPDLKGALITLGIIAVVIGWGVIEFVAWVVSNISFSWGG